MAAKKAISGMPLKVTKLSGKSVSDLCKNYIDKSIPVIFWATQGMNKAYSGKKIQWIAPEHCLLLVGYNQNNFYFNDPLVGKNVSYSRNAVENAYYALSAQAVVIEPVSPAFNPFEGDFTKLPESLENLECVNTAYGSFDLQIKPFADIDFSLSYSSNKLSSGKCGIGWYTNYEKCIKKSGNNLLLYENPSSYAIFKKQGDYYISEASGLESFTPQHFVRRHIPSRYRQRL